MTHSYGARLFDQHAAMLAASGITPEHARTRGYVSVDTKKRLEDLDGTKEGRSVPGLLVPEAPQRTGRRGVTSTDRTSRERRNGKLVKYETPWQQRNGLDVPPGVGPPARRSDRAAVRH